jgi:nucleotide-binding universal stress UspA family protein
MYKRILAAVDGSSTSELALREAIKLAKQQQARLRLVHVVDEARMAMYPEFRSTEELNEPLRKAGRRILEKAEAILRESGMEAESRLIELETLGRHVSDVIVEEGQRWPADLIVVGTHGRRGVRHLLLGSVAESVARRTTVPVLLIREK